MSNAGDDRIRITREDVEQHDHLGAPSTLVARGPQEPRISRRGLVFAGAVGAGVLVLLAIVLLSHSPRVTPNERCWKELRSTLRLAEGGQGSQERAKRILDRLKGIKTEDVTDGDLLEACDLSILLFQYVVDYPDDIEGFWRAFEDGLFLRVDRVLQHLKVEDKAKRLVDLCKKLEQRYGGSAEHSS